MNAKTIPAVVYGELGPTILCDTCGWHFFIDPSAPLPTRPVECAECYRKRVGGVFVKRGSIFVVEVPS